MLDNLFGWTFRAISGSLFRSDPDGLQGIICSIRNFHQSQDKAAICKTSILLSVFSLALHWPFRRASALAVEWIFGGQSRGWRAVGGGGAIHAGVLTAKKRLAALEMERRGQLQA